MKSPRVAIVADWIIGGGAERVVSELHALYPEAPIYASYCSTEWRQKLDGKVVTGYLQHWPFGALRKFAGLISPFRISWYRHLDFRNYDVVITATGNGEAKHIRPPQGVKHICYCFTPVHYYWRHYQTYLQNPGFGPLNFLARFGLRLFVKPLRKKDYQAAKRVNQFIAISTHIQADIKKYYGRNSIVIAPPVNVERFLHVAGKSKRQGFITMGRQTAYKHTELLVDTCTQANLPLTVVGNGPEHADLVKRAGPTVTFLTNVADEEMADVLGQAQAFLFAGVEDFGVAPVEGMAAGLPLIAYRAGGALDYVIEGKTGLFFDALTVESIQKTLSTFSPADFDSKLIRKHATTFSADIFQQNIKSHTEKVLT
jgi:glycosyltransferase involved in cell wall biosynthesis